VTPPRIAVSSSSVKRTWLRRSRAIVMKRGMDRAAMVQATALRSTGTGLVSMKRGLVRRDLAR
jgi:hypothetical protein